jgi:hypothetical protein
MLCKHVGPVIKTKLSRLDFRSFSLNAPVTAMYASWRVQTPARFLSSSFQPEIAEEWVVSTQESIVVCEVPIAYCTQSTTDTCAQQQKPPSTDFLVFDASEQVIICTVCSSAVPLKHLDGHLLRRPHQLNHKVRPATVASFVGLPIAQVFEDLVPREDGSKPLSYLGLPIPDFCCPHCSIGKTKNWD